MKKKREGCYRKGSNCFSKAARFRLLRSYTPPPNKLTLKKCRRLAIQGLDNPDYSIQTNKGNERHPIQRLGKALEAARASLCPTLCPTASCVAVRTHLLLYTGSSGRFKWPMAESSVLDLNSWSQKFHRGDPKPNKLSHGQGTTGTGTTAIRNTVSKITKKHTNDTRYCMIKGSTMHHFIFFWSSFTCVASEKKKKRFKAETQKKSSSISEHKTRFS